MIIGCLFGIFGALAPRLALILLWLARPVYFNAVFGSGFLACIGFLFLPFTTLIYALLAEPTLGRGVGLNFLDWIILIFAFLIDIGAVGGAAYANKNSIPGQAQKPVGTV